MMMKDTAPFNVNRFFGTLCLASFSLNAYVYGLVSERFRSGYLKTWRFLVCWYRKEKPYIPDKPVKVKKRKFRMPPRVGNELSPSQKRIKKAQEASVEKLVDSYRSFNENIADVMIMPIESFKSDDLY